VKIVCEKSRRKLFYMTAMPNTIAVPHLVLPIGLVRLKTVNPFLSAYLLKAPPLVFFTLPFHFFYKFYSLGRHIRRPS
jgi:hypothetical protein